MIYTSGLLIFFGLLLGSIKVCKNGYNQSYFSKDMTDAWKGIAALLIVFHHISQYVEIPRMFSIMRYIGFIMVAVFFFISGYGLVYGLNHKTSYLKNFLKRRLLSIFLPYWIVNVVVIVFLTFLNRRPTISDCIFSLLGFENITGLWFVTAIVIFYIFFWFAFMKFEGRNRYITLGLCLVLYIMVVVY